MKEYMMLKKIKSRDPTGLEELMERYIPYVCAVCWNILRYSMTKEDAEEVVSDVFLIAWDRANDLRAGHVKQWLGEVARNKAKNKLREIGAELPLEDDALEIPGWDDPQHAVEKAEESNMVRIAVNQLPEPDREIFLRYYYFMQTIHEISVLMGLNESTIKTKLRRGRMRLKDFLTRWDIS